MIQPREGFIHSFHWLQADMRSGSGRERPWTVGETRSVPTAKLCERGYHSSPTLWDALGYAPGPVACLVEVSEPVASDATPNAAKQVSLSRRLVAAVNVERELRLWGCECAERALLRERERGREPDPRCGAAVETARRYANGQATAEELAAARDAAWDAEITWQRQRFDQIVTAILLAEVQ